MSDAKKVWAVIAGVGCVCVGLYFLVKRLFSMD